mmetsp:Transcript_3265/g.8418  ORF Transcript_3265/g.8418 Transcript_3265/m.8418 type:complete len:91 (-) Transcript_3265:57-329(-)
MTKTSLSTSRKTACRWPKLRSTQIAESGSIDDLKKNEHGFFEDVSLGNRSGMGSERSSQEDQNKWQTAVDKIVASAFTQKEPALCDFYGY